MALGSTIRKLTRKAIWDDNLVPGLKVTDPATVRLTTPGAFDPATGATAPDATTDVPVRVLSRAYRAFEVGQSSGIISAGDLEVTIFADASLDGLDENAFLIYKGKTWRIAQIVTDTLDDQKFLYTCRVSS